MFALKPDDVAFTDSPDAGNPTCICSRCAAPIPAGFIPVRVWPDGMDIEFRFCEQCLAASGITTSRPEE